MNKLKAVSTIFFMLTYLCSFASPTQQSDEHYMQIAINLAKKNPKAPFAAIIVDNITDKILSEGLNASNINPTFHGEMVAIDNCIQKNPNVDWSKVTLYTTAEPCPMCQSAIVWAQIPKVVFATSIGYLTNHGWNQINIPASEINNKASFYKGTITGGVLAEQSNILFDRQIARSPYGRKS
ncbi:MAG: nucleoside deaminase [Legionellaceae bacterium]|nr:nucleoside deaminase [Legionellaceae bacterium]